MELIFKAGEKLSVKDIEKVCAAMGLILTMKGSLKSLPENLHWHYKMAKQLGVLEITLLLNENKLILNCKKNRTGEWISKAVEDIEQALNLLPINP